MPSRKLRAPFPFVSANGSQLFFHANSTWKQLLADLSQGKERVWVENYIFESGEAGQAVAEALIQSVTAGADVRVHADGLGSRQLEDSLVDKMLEAGIQFHRFNNPPPLLKALATGVKKFIRRTHRRIFVIDNHTAWVGGIGFGDTWWPATRENPVRDTMLRVTGPLVAQLASSFERLWNGTVGPLPSAAIEEAQLGQARAVVQHPVLGRHFRRGLHRRMHNSKNRLWLATPYFIPSLRLRRALIHAQRRGVDVRILLPGPHMHDHPGARIAAHRHYGHLLFSGIRIFEYQPTFLHAKTAVFDDEWLVVGSANLDRLSFFVNHELVVELRDKDLTQQAADQFEIDFQECREISVSEWRGRSLFHRLREWYFGLFDRIL